MRPLAAASFSTLKSLSVWSVLGFAIAGVLTLGALANSYAHMLIKICDYNNLRSEREALKTHCHNLESVVTMTHGELMSLQSLATEVAMAYGFSDHGHQGMPADVLMVANLGHASRRADFGASLDAFNMMRVRPVLASFASSAASPLRERLYEDYVTPSIWPVRGIITAGFGQRMDPFTGEGNFHKGVDIAAPAGTLVRAAADGILFHAGPDSGYGNEALIDHGYGLTHQVRPPQKPQCRCGTRSHPRPDYRHRRNDRSRHWTPSPLRGSRRRHSGESGELPA